MDDFFLHGDNGRLWRNKFVMEYAKGYQHNLSRQSPILLDSMYKLPKARKMLRIIEDYSPKEISGLVAIDIGCSGGAITEHLALQFRMVIGIDIDGEALRLAALQPAEKKPVYITGDSMRLPLGNKTADIVICNHVYEHVPDPRKLFAEIGRVLRDDGFCYFGCANRLIIKEPHYHLPFLSWLPKKVANLYMRAAAKGSYYYEDLMTYWGLTELTKQFYRTDYTIRILKEPERFSATDMIQPGSIITRMPTALYGLFYWALPSYIWILSKRMIP